MKDISSEATIDIITFDSPEGKEIYRHSTSHILAHAVKELFPDAKPAIGPAIEDGFYYDFDMDRPFTPEDLTAIEKKMSEIIKKNNPFVRKNIPKKDAIDLFKKMGEDYKVELISEIADEEMSIYEEGGFVDLCRGPHVFSTGAIKAFKLLSIAGAYWRGNEKNKMLQRIYGTAYDSKEKLKRTSRFPRRGQKRDHRKARERARPVQRKR